MLHAFLLLFSFYLIVLGFVICAMLFWFGIRAKNWIWLITLPGILIIALLNLNFVCHIFHLPALIPHQKQIVSGIHTALDVAALLLVAIKLYEVYVSWRKKRMSANVPPSV